MKNKCLIITRPQNQAKNLIKCCEDNQWHYLLMSALEIVPNLSILKDLNQKISSANALFLVSPTAIDVVADYLDWSNLSQDIMVLGQNSALRLQQKGVKKIFYPQVGQDSESLLQLPYWHQQVGKLIILRGQDGRNYLADQLSQIGWKVEYIEIYQRREKVIDFSLLSDEFFQHYQTVLLFTSSEQVDIWFKQIPRVYCEKLKTLLYLSIHQRISDRLSMYGIENIISTATDHQSIVNKLRQIWE